MVDLPGTEHVVHNAQRAVRVFTFKKTKSTAVLPPRWFLIAALVLYIAFFAAPVLGSFYYSLTDWDGMNPAPNFIGLENFVTILTQDPDAMNALWNTLRFALVVTVASNVLGLGLALLLQRAGRLQTPLRALSFAPAILSAVVVAFTWDYILNSDVGVSAIVHAVAPSVPMPNWLGDAGLVLYTIAGIAVWQGLGITAVIYQAALKGVPQELTDAAQIDGAGAWSRFWAVTFPLIAPAFTVNMLLAMLSGLKIFDLVFVMTQGGPGGASDVLSTHLFQVGFEEFHYGYATALAVLMFLLVFILSFVLLLVLRRREVRG